MPLLYLGLVKYGKTNQFKIKNKRTFSFWLLPFDFLIPHAQCPLALSEAVRVASRREGMPNAQCPMPND